jgi:hypothetical protein
MQGSCAQALKAALELAGTGVAVFPCAHNKHPCTPHGFYNASKDASEVRELWRRHADPLVGVRTGEASGLSVLDVDAKHAAARQWFAENRDRLLPTRAHRTPGGGLHLTFAHVDGLRCSQSRIARGVDVKAEGGYAIWYPAAGLPVLCEGPLAPWPAWLLARLKPKAPPPPPSRLVIPDDRRLRQLLRRVATAHEGERNAIAFWGACRFAEMVATGLISETDAIALIIDAAMAAGLPRGEAAATARSGLRTAGRS